MLLPHKLKKGKVLGDMIFAEHMIGCHQPKPEFPLAIGKFYHDVGGVISKDISGIPVLFDRQF